MKLLAIQDVARLPVGSIVYPVVDGRLDGSPLIVPSRGELTQVALLPERAGGQQPGGDPVGPGWGKAFALVHEGRGRLPTHKTASRQVQAWMKTLSRTANPGADSPGWLGRGAEVDDYLVFYEPGGSGSRGHYIVDYVRRDGDVGNEVAEVAISDFPNKGDAMQRAILAAHEHAARKGVQSEVLWRVNHDSTLSQIGHVGASHPQPVVANPGPGSQDDEDDDEDAEGDLRYANPKALARRLKNAM